MNDVAEFMTRNPWFLVAAAIATFWKPISWANKSGGRVIRWFASPSRYDQIDVEISAKSASFLIARLGKSLVLSLAHLIAGLLLMDMSTFGVVRSSFGTSGFWVSFALTLLGSAFLTVAILSALYTYLFCSEVAEKLRGAEEPPAKDDK